MVRRVVTTHKAGKAAVLTDGEPPRARVFQHIPGMEFSFAWATGPDPVILSTGGQEAVKEATTMIPKPGESRLLFVTFPPDAWMMRDDFDPISAMAEFSEHQSEMAAVQEIDHPGMHRTDSIDYVVVLDGELTLELDDGEAVSLKTGDVVVQDGTRHAWRNYSDRPASLVIVLIGATRR